MWNSSVPPNLQYSWTSNEHLQTYFHMIWLIAYFYTTSLYNRWNMLCYSSLDASMMHLFSCCSVTDAFRSKRSCLKNLKFLRISFKPFSDQLLSFMLNIKFFFKLQLLLVFHLNIIVVFILNVKQEYPKDLVLIYLFIRLWCYLDSRF